MAILAAILADGGCTAYFNTDRDTERAAAQRRTLAATVARPQTRRGVNNVRWTSPTNGIPGPFKQRAVNSVASPVVLAAKVV